MIGLGSDKKKKRQRLRQGKRQRQTLDREVCDEKADGDVALRGLEALIHRTWTPRTSRRAVNSLNIFCRHIFSVPKPTAWDFCITCGHQCHPAMRVNMQEQKSFRKKDRFELRFLCVAKNICCKKWSRDKWCNFLNLICCALNRLLLFPSPLL